MATLTREAEIIEYMRKKTDEQQQILLDVAKNFLRDEEQVSIPDEVMKEIWKDREDYLNGIGKNYTREEAREYVLRTRKPK